MQTSVQKRITNSAEHKPIHKRTANNISTTMDTCKDNANNHPCSTTSTQTQHLNDSMTKASKHQHTKHATFQSPPARDRPIDNHYYKMPGHLQLSKLEATPLHCRPQNLGPNLQRNFTMRFQFMLLLGLKLPHL